MRKLAILSVMVILGLPQTSVGAEAKASSTETKSSTSSFSYEVTLSGGYLGLATSSSQLNLAPAFYYKPLKTDLIQVGGELGYQKTSHRGGSASNMEALAGVAINVGNLSSAFYCMAGVALKSGSGGTAEDSTATDPNGLGYHFLCGKRIPIGGNPSWVFKPSVGVIAGGTSGMVFRPLAVSFLF